MAGSPSPGAGSAPKYVAFAFFCVAWDAFLVFWYSMALSGKDVPWIMVVFPIGHLAVGVGLTYSTLAGFVNRTRIAVEGNRLLVQHGPLPWPGRRDLPVDDLKQLFTAEVVSRGKNGSVSYSYNVSAIRTNGAKALVLVKGLDDVGQALFLEQTFEKQLGIVDVPVAGEVPRIG